MPLTHLWPIWMKPPIMTAHEIHVWCSDLDQPSSIVESCRNVLSHEEIAVANRLRSSSDVSRYVVAHGLLRKIIATYLEIAPEVIAFQQGRSGKPLLEFPTEAPKLRFNMSHSGDAAVYALSASNEVGIDLEQLRIVAGAEAIVHRNFSTIEQATWSALNAEDRHTAFLRCWTRKEAYLKATGVGLEGDLRGFSVSYAANQDPALLSIDNGHDNPAQWSLLELVPVHGYVGALAVRAKSLTVICSAWTQEP